MFEGGKFADFLVSQRLRLRFFASYVQGQSQEKNIREYFYYVDHNGFLFLDDARMKNFTSCYKGTDEFNTYYSSWEVLNAGIVTNFENKGFLTFFFKHLRKNDTLRYSIEFPYISLCGCERNFLRCEDVPVVYTKIVKIDNSDEERLAYCNSHDALSVKFDPSKISVDSKSGRVYYPANENLGGVGLVAWPLAAEFSKFFVVDENKTPIKIKWHEKEYDLSDELIGLLKMKKT
uniref:Uncharacterized protein n=1 Tax=Romanomermis culicivorax TaxID=13658 RepID=A0A915HSQ0_ROMCU